MSSKKIKGWIVRDSPMYEKDPGTLMLCDTKPYREDGYWVSDGDIIEAFKLESELFPEITWENEPVQVEITIKYDKD